MEALEEQSPAVSTKLLIGLGLGVILAGGAFAALFIFTQDSVGTPNDVSIDDVSQECIDDVAQIADEQADLNAELGEDAPNFDFLFPESCFE